MYSERWFPAPATNAQVMGRFVDIEKVDPVASREAGRPVPKRVPALQSKVVGSHDISVQILKPFNEAELKSRFPGAWDFYEEQKAAAEQRPEMAAAPEVVSRTIEGHGLDKVDFLPRDRIPWLMMQGVQTVEQLASLPDIAAQNMGRDVFKWRKAAKHWLERT